MIAVNAPMTDRMIPTAAIRLLSERLPNTPKNTPNMPKSVPSTGTNPVHKLNTPNAAEIKA